MAKIDSSSQIIESTVEETATVYKNVRVIRSEIGCNSTIGDFSTIRDSAIGNYCQIQRNCDLLRAKIGDYTIIEKNAVIHDIEIGKYCEISWHCSMGGDNHNYKLPSIHHFYWHPSFGFEDSKETVGGSNFYKKLNSEECSIGNDVWVGSV